MRIYGLSAMVLFALSGTALAQYYPPPQPAPYYEQQQQQQPPAPYYQQQPQGYTQPPQGYYPQPAPPRYQPPQQPDPSFTQAPAAPPTALPMAPPQQQSQLTDAQNGFQRNGRKMSLSDMLAARAQNGQHGASTVVKVAVGDATNANYTNAFQHVNEVASGNLSLHADPSIGSYESATGVCLGIDAAAFVQMDSAVLRAATPIEEKFQTADERAPTSCRREMKLFDAIYPDIGYLIVNKDSSYSSMHSLLTSGRPKIIAVGLPGSGGANTLQYLLASHQNWHEGVSSTQPLGGDEALTALANHQVDAYFVMEPPVSKFITDNVNSGQYAGKFKLIGINPYDSFFDTKDGKGRTMYQAAKLPGGGWWSGSTPTISVDVVLIMNRGFVEGNEAAAHSFVNSVRQAAPAIRRDAGTDPAWQPATRLR